MGSFVAAARVLTLFEHGEGSGLGGQRLGLVWLSGRGCLNPPKHRHQLWAVPVKGSRAGAACLHRVTAWIRSGLLCKGCCQPVMCMYTSYHLDADLLLHAASTLHAAGLDPVASHPFLCLDCQAVRHGRLATTPLFCTYCCVCCDQSTGAGWPVQQGRCVCMCCC